MLNYSGFISIWPRVVICLVTGCGEKGKGFHTLFGKGFHTPWTERFPYLSLFKVSIPVWVKVSIPLSSRIETHDATCPNTYPALRS